MDLTRLLAPRSIVVVGATDRPASYGGQTARNLMLAGFEGGLVGVNPGRTEAHGIPCLPTLREAVDSLGTAPDAVVVATPAAGVPDLVDECGRLGAGGVVVYAAGFAEAPGEEQGPALQAALVAAAARHDLPVIGPNGNGVVAVHSRAPLWGDAVTLRKPGGIALITQSGNVGVNALVPHQAGRASTPSSPAATRPSSTHPTCSTTSPAPTAYASQPSISRSDGEGPRLASGARPLRRRRRPCRRAQGRAHRGRPRSRRGAHRVPRW